MSGGFLVLSHPLRPDAPVWPGNPPASATEPHHRIEAGDGSNSTVLHLFSHSGTHVDTPWHFNPAGPTAAELPIEAFVFSAPRLIEVPTAGGSFITRAALEAHAASIVDADLILIRTGWGSRRATDPAAYATAGPLLHPDGARWLMDDHPRLRAIATDAISIGSPRFRPESVETHHVLTGVGRTDDRFVLIYEDVAMPPAAERAIRVYAWPLFVEGSDGSPVTVVAELGDDPGRG